MRPVGFVALACTLVLALSGCGKDDSKKPAAETGPTRDPALVKYLADATAICAKAQTDQDAIRAEYAEEAVTKLREALAAVSARYVREVEDLRALTPPESIRARAETWLDEFAKAAERVKTLKASDAYKVDPFAKSDPLADDLSLGICTANGA